ncbi:MAG: hypothetical protein OEW05_14840, partial [Candidatus Aminicenantes bacterium]|nr:hypothetical protein [Candidatus Aminicenantes bacterium]
AAWAEAYGTNRSFYTRFIIWNCPESGREFIADTNYNIRVKTPAEDFEDETRAARTILCHEGARVEKSPGLGKSFVSAGYGFSFSYPERWFIFDSPFYVPFPDYEGVRDGRLGSILGLPSDQNLEVTLKWLPLTMEKEQMTMGVDERIQARLAGEIQAVPGIISFRQQGFEHFTVAGRKVYRIWGGYTARAPLETKGSALTVEGIFQAASWNIESKAKTLVVLLKTAVFDYQSNLSTPTRDAQDRVLRDFVSAVR